MAVEESADPSAMGKSLTRIAILGVALSLKVLYALLWLKIISIQ